MMIEKLENRILNELMVSLKPSIDSMIDKLNESYKKRTGLSFSEFDREMIELNMIYDMAKSIEKYTLPTDSLVSFNKSISKKGNIEISAVIMRNSTEYNFNTEAIYAGGYNVQILHYRYLTKTNLPQTGNTSIVKEFGEKIKKLTKLEKLQDENKGYEKSLKLVSSQLENSLKLSDTEIIEILKSEGELTETTWSDILDRGAAKNYNNSEDEFNEKEKKYRDSRVSFWKMKNIKWKEDYIKSLKSNIEKNNIKISKLINE